MTGFDEQRNRAVTRGMVFGEKRNENGHLRDLAGSGGKVLGGWGGIRTHGTVSRTPVFKTGSLNHSDTHPHDLPSQPRLLPKERGSLPVVGNREIRIGF